MQQPNQTSLTPDRIMQVGMGFCASKTLLTAVKLELFTFLGERSRNVQEIRQELGLHERGILDFLDALVSMNFLNREGLGALAIYSNTSETSTFLDKNKPTYCGGMLEMANDRLYKFWGDLEEALKTGKPQNEKKVTGKSTFESIYEDPAVLRQFLDAMAGNQKAGFEMLAEKLDLSKYETLCDIGGANGCLSICLAEKNSHLKCISADLPVVTTIAKETVEKLGLGDQIIAESLDMMKSDFPKVDVITMGNVLHDWDLETKKFLIKKAYDALNPDGVFVVIENIIDDERKENTLGLMLSLNMLIETDGGFDTTFKALEGWSLEAGFKSAKKIHLGGPRSAVVAFKSS